MLLVKNKRQKRLYMIVKLFSKIFSKIIYQNIFSTSIARVVPLPICRVDAPPTTIPPNLVNNNPPEVVSELRYTDVTPLITKSRGVL